MAQQQLLQILADGELHSYDSLCAALNLNPSALAEQLSAVETLGLRLESGGGTGYRLPGGLNLFNEQLIKACFGSVAEQHICAIEIHDQLDSSNRYAMELARQGPVSGHAVLAEMQSAGRGRLGKSWVSPFGRNMYLSLIWRFNAGAGALDGLSLAVSVALSRCLHKLGIHEFGVKWPNDLLSADKKFCGILVELAGNLEGPCTVVIGIGANVSIPDDEATAIDQPWTDLSRVAGYQVDRNQLAGTLINELVVMLLEYEQHGFRALKSEWEAGDLLRGESVTVHLGPNRITGIASGVAPTGALLVETDSGMREFNGGEISVRKNR